jgi:hypothetical protein
MIKSRGLNNQVTGMDDNIWEYPFGDIDDEDDGLFRDEPRGR